MTPRRPQPACTTLPRPRRSLPLDTRYVLTAAGHAALATPKES